MSSSTSKPGSDGAPQRRVAPLVPSDVPAITTSNYPAPFQSVVQGRSKRALGNPFGLLNFGVNHTTLEPGASSALQHYHTTQDEFLYILQGTGTCRLGDDQEMELPAGTCMGFPAGEPRGHCLVNRTQQPVVYLEIGDRSSGEFVDYPEVDMQAVDVGGGILEFRHKDGTPYPK